MPRFVPRERKHKKLARVRKCSNASESNSNADALIAESQSARADRKDVLRSQLLAQQHGDGKVSSKKRKRLDKYIETKLKKEENAALVKKLEGQRIDTSLLRSSKRLGRVQESQREKLSRALKERDAGIGDEALLLENRRQVEDDASESEEDVQVRDRDGDGDGEDSGVALDQPQMNPQPGFGRGLKRALDVDESGDPVIKKRRRRKREHTPSTDGVGQDAVVIDTHGEEDQDEWLGFSSEEGPATARGHHVDSLDSDLPTSGDESDRDESDRDESLPESDSTLSSGPEADRKPRVSAFKAWADTLRNAAMDFTPSTAYTTTSGSDAKANFKPRPPSPDALLSESISTNAATKPAASISIPRSEEIQAARLELPVVQEEQRILESINSHPIVVICGATGSGKTTQIPQMLLENGYGSRIGSSSISNPSSEMRPECNGIIGVTQPRRVAATSVANRVSHELGGEYAKRVAHQVRYDSNVGKDTAIKFMTDGILLREIQNDFTLSKYSVIVLDEAHERSVNTDILIGMLARIVPLRLQLSREEAAKHYPLKLVIMSATLSQGVDSFIQNEKLWKPCGGLPPVVEVEGRQYPVTVHFARRTRRDYVGEVVEKVVKGHKKLPPGGMLVFLTGQHEIQAVAKRIRERTGESADMTGSRGDFQDFDGDGLRDRMDRTNAFVEGDEDSDGDSNSEAEIKLDNEVEEDEFEILPDPIQTIAATSTLRSALKPLILPLYAALPQKDQLKVFLPPPAGSRLIVLATNVAETSLTIPGIRYVIDCGRVKEKKYNVSTGVQTFQVDWISRASAEQRKGRAGRIGPGHVWRLYSSNVYEEFFAEETVPEILRTGLESVVLQLKAMEIGNVAKFPFPTSPEMSALNKAEMLLRNLGATAQHGITEIGKQIMQFPVSPRFGRILVLAQKNGLLQHAIALVAGLAVGDLFIAENHGLLAADKTGHSSNDGDDDGVVNVQAERAMKAAMDQRHQTYTRAQASLSQHDERSDAIKLLTAVAAYADSAINPINVANFCKDYWLREKGMAEVQLIRQQLHSIMENQDNRPRHYLEEKITPPSEKQVAMLNQLVAAGYIDQVAIRTDLLPNDSAGFGRKPRRAIEVAYRTLLPSSLRHTPNQSGLLPDEIEISRSVFLHPSSVLARLSPEKMPGYLVYSHLSQASPVTEGVKIRKTRFHPLTPISPKTLAVLAEGGPLLSIGKPIGRIIELGRDVRGDEGRECWVGVGLKAPESEIEWPLGTWKVLQRRRRREWIVERVVAR